MQGSRKDQAAASTGIGRRWASLAITRLRSSRSRRHLGLHGRGGAGARSDGYVAGIPDGGQIVGRSAMRQRRGSAPAECECARETHPSHVRRVQPETCL